MLSNSTRPHLYTACNRLEQLLFFLLPCLPFFMARATGSLIFIPIGLLIIAALLLGKRPVPAMRAAWLWMAGALALACTSLLYSPNPGGAADFLLKALPPLLLMVLFISLPRFSLPSATARALQAGVMAGVTLLWLQVVYGFSLIDRLGQKNNPDWILDLNRGAVVLTLAFLVLWPWRWSNSSPARDWRNWLFLLLFVATLGLTVSETAKFALLAGIGMLMLSWIMPLRWLGHLIFGGLVAIVLLLPLLLTQLDPLLRLIAPLWDASSSDARLQIWQLVNAKIMEVPLLGHGFEATRWLGLELTTVVKEGPVSVNIIHPHNAILQIWVEFGLLGALLSAAGLVLGWRAYLRTPKVRQRAIAIMTTGITATAAVGYNIWQPWLFSAMLLAFYLALQVAERERQP